MRIGILRVIIAVSLLAQPMVAGCANLSSGVDDSVKPGWYDPPPEDAFETWPGVETMNVTFPENRWLSDYLDEVIDEGMEQGDILPPSYLHTRRLLSQNTSFWAFDDAQGVLFLETKESLEEEGFEQEELLALWERTEDRYEEAWEETNDTGISTLAAPLVRWSFREHVGYVQLQERGDMNSAASLLGFARLVNDIVENATTMPGDPLAKIAPEDLEPLVSLASETTIPVTYEPRLPEEGLVWAAEAESYAKAGNPHASAMLAMLMLIVYETFHMTYLDEVPTVEETQQALLRLDEAANDPLHEHTAQYAWRAANRASSDPTSMLPVVATDRVWPVIEDIVSLMKHGEPVDWSGFEELQERWEETWIPTLQHDGEAYDA